MKVAVTGGAGYIGSHTSNLLIEKGYDVTVIDDLSTGFLESLSQDIKFVKGTVLDSQFLNRVFSITKFDVVIHFAAKLIVPESCVNPMGYYQNNVVGSLEVFSQCVKHGIKNVVFSSTAAVYGNSEKTVLAESDAVNPINPYGQTKLFTERMLKDYSKAYNLNYVVLRYFNVAGADPNLKNGQRSKNATHLIKVACEAANKKRNQVQVFGVDYETPDGTCIRDYIHVQDLAEAHIDAIEYLLSGGESDTFNCGYGKGSSVKEVLSTMQRVSGSRFEIIESGRRQGDPSCLISDNSKILTKLKWKPKFNDLELICKTAFDWETKNA